MENLNYYRTSPLGAEWGPFSDEERAELDASARRPIYWRVERDPMKTWTAPHPEAECSQCADLAPIVRKLRRLDVDADINPWTGGNIHVIDVVISQGHYVLANTEGWSWYDDQRPGADGYDTEGFDHRFDPPTDPADFARELAADIDAHRDDEPDT